MRTARELYANAVQSTEANVAKTLAAITDELVKASDSGQFEYEILLYKYPVLKKRENINAIITELTALGFTVNPHLDDRYPSLQTITVSWEK